MRAAWLGADGGAGKMEDGVVDGFGSLLKLLLHVIIWNFVLFNLGRFVLLAVTLGRYPRGHYLRAHVDRIALAGLAVLAAAWLVVAGYNRLTGA